MADIIKQEEAQLKIPTPEEVLASLQAKAPAAAADAYPPGPETAEEVPAAAAAASAAPEAKASEAKPAAASAAAPEEPEVPYSKLTPGVQKRVDTLTARNILATKRAEEAEARAARAEQALAKAKTASLAPLQQQVSQQQTSVDTDSFFDGLIQPESPPGSPHEPTEQELENLPPILAEAAKMTFQMAKEREREKQEQALEQEVNQLSDIIGEQRRRFPEFQDKDKVEEVIAEARSKGVPFAALPALFEAKHLAAVEAENALLRSKLGIEEISSVVPSGGPAIPAKTSRDKIPTPEEVWADLERKRGSR